MKQSFSFMIFFMLIFTISCTKTAKKNQFTAKNEYMVQSVLWYQQSGEMKALYYQAYNTARLMLDEYLNNTKSDRKKAVIVDIDETILSNVRYEADMILSDSSSTKSYWKRWVDSAKSDTLPGALEFLKYAQKKGVEVFYISNRMTADIASSLKNLNKFNFPYSDEKHLIFKSDQSSSKEARRRQVARDYEIILICGDNLGDFSSAFDDRSIKTYSDSIQAFKSQFGKKFIILPNPMYGYWEKQIYGDGNPSFNQRDSIRKARLKGF